ncbi:hypothetical protein C5167_024003 [Papaver somniferum]|uniref:Cytochrome P450 n=1 Tax=Papaver somniferum TaxID=3469 RepID=A0A4Y7JNU8_PAPSO|nr:hypothetical protein C5167_024003 [Papaver somniferum]
MNMIINETLQLYPPVVMIMRMVEKEVKLGANNLIIPPNTEVIITPLAPHHDPEIWGEHVQFFKPERFSEGILTAAHNKFGFVPFSSGPRNCVGMNFAVNQAKIAFTMILQNYSLPVSPGYIHSPIHGLVSCPQYGLQLTLHPIE